VQLQKKCIENKCKTIKKHCKVTNIRDRTSAGEKLIELKKRVFENERSKRLKKLNDECNCYKQEDQNLEGYERKRKRVLDRYQSCKKIQNELKELLGRTKTYHQKEIIKSKLRHRGRKCRRINKKLKRSSRVVSRYQKISAKKK